MSKKDIEAKKVFAGNMQALMDSRGISQAALARLIDESEARLSNYRRAHKIPGVGVAARIAEALGTTVDELMKQKKLSRKSKKTALSS